MYCPEKYFWTTEVTCVNTIFLFQTNMLFGIVGISTMGTAFTIVINVGTLTMNFHTKTP